MSKIENRGGSRTGAGRKPHYGEETKVLRIPISKIEFIKLILAENATKTGNKNDFFKTLDVQPINDAEFNALPLADEGVAAGPVEFVELSSMGSVVDLEFIFGPNPAARFAVRVLSLSMRDAGIEIDDVLAVNKSVEARHNDIVIARINGAYTVKRLMIEKLNGRQFVWLKAENPEYENIYFKEDEEFIVWGVVMCNLKMMRGRHGR